MLRKRLRVSVTAAGAAGLLCLGTVGGGRRARQQAPAGPAWLITAG
jgi:hypothetical protein